MEMNKTDVKSLILFWTRLIVWIGVSCIVPIVVFSIKFGLFKETHYEPIYDELGNVINSSPPALNGWGIVSCLIVGFTIFSILKEVSKSYVGYSFTKQIVKGITNTIPIVICFVICYFLDNALDNVRYCLAVLIITKLISIPFNPLPMWRYKKCGIENYDDFIKTLTERIKSIRKEG